LEIIPYIVPSVLVGIPLGTWLIRWMEPETFRRICMSFDVVIVGFGLSRVSVELQLAPGTLAYSIFAAIVTLNAYLLFQFFQAQARRSRQKDPDAG
jgi:hypothetical protein